METMENPMNKDFLGRLQKHEIVGYEGGARLSVSQVLSNKQ